MNKLWKTAITNSLLTSLYISLVGAFMSYGEHIKIGKEFNLLVPLTMLSLFVLSAAVTSYLIFGKPAQMYVDGEKKEALKLLGYTIASFAVITLICLFILVLLSTSK